MGGDARSKLHQHRLRHRRGDRQPKLRRLCWQGPARVIISACSVQMISQHIPSSSINWLLREPQKDSSEAVPDTGAIGTEKLPPFERCRQPRSTPHVCRQLPAADAVAMGDVLPNHDPGTFHKQTPVIIMLHTCCILLVNQISRNGRVFLVS